MQVSRLMRGRLSSSCTSSRCRGPHVSPPSCILSECEGDRFKGLQRGYCIYRFCNSTTSSKSTTLTTLKHLQPVVQINCKKYQVQYLLGWTFATSCLATWKGHANIANCEQVQGGKPVPTSRQTVIEVVEQKESRLLIVLKYMWIPSLVLLTVATGYQFPYSLSISVVLLLWSTKPKANSIYGWVEKRRLQEAIEKQRIEKFGFHFNPKATVMHVEVRDYTLFCLARVTSMTQNATLVGFLGGWWVFYSSSSTIAALGFRSLLPTPPPALKKYLEKFDNEMLTESCKLGR